MKKELNQSNLRMSPVVFDATEHTYTLGEKTLQGVTPIISWMYPDTYTGIPEDVLMRAAEYGTMIHSKCQLADAIGMADEPIIMEYMQMMQDKNLIPLMHEYIVSDEAHVASAVDIVCRDGSLCDIKTTSKLHRENVALQLSIYALLFEEQTGEQAGDLYAVWLPKEQYGKPQVVALPRIDAEVCRFIIEEYLAGHEYNDARERLDAVDLFGEGALVTEAEDVMDEYIRLDAESKRIGKRMDELKAQLMEGMQRYEKKTLQSERYTVSVRAASVRRSVDSKKLQSQYPDIYEQVVKESKVAESLQIKLL